MNINPKMITLARESRGLSQTELASKTGVSISNISRLELGFIIGINTNFIEKLGEVLNYPLSFFYQDFPINPPNVHYRKRLTLSPKIVRKADALMNIYRGNIEKMLQTIVLPEANIPIFSEEKYETPQKVAAYLRSYWGIEKGPIKDLAALVERNGIMIVMFDFETDKIDGRSMMTTDGHPIIFLNKSFSGDRLRLTLSHELGHIAMHLRTFPTFGRDEENEAFEFASEFLMPFSEVQYELKNKVTLEKLADLKRVWKVSMAAILYSTEKKGNLTQNQSRYLWAQYSANGYKRSEPIPVYLDQPTLLRRMVDLYITSHELTNDIEAVSKMAEIFSLRPQEFKDKFMIPRNDLRVA